MEVNLQKKIAVEIENQNYSRTQRLYTLRDLESAVNPISLQVLKSIKEPQDSKLSDSSLSLKVICS